MKEQEREYVVNENEKIIYYLLGFSKTHISKHMEQFLDALKNANETDIITSSHKMSESLSFQLFCRFYIYLQKKEINKVYSVLEMYRNEGIEDEFYTCALILAMANDYNCDSMCNLNDESYKSLLKAYYLYTQGDYQQAYKEIVKIVYINRLYYIRELIYLMIGIEIGLTNEIESIFEELYKLNKKNEILKLVEAYYAAKQKDFNRCVSRLNEIAQLKNPLYTKIMIANYIENKNFDKALSFLQKAKIENNDYYFMGQLLHAKGILDEAYECYKKADERDYPVNKMLGIIDMQMGDYAAAFDHFTREKEIRYEDIEIRKYLKYISLQRKWSHGKHSSGYVKQYH